MTISIIIPAYNEAGAIRKCLDSITRLNLHSRYEIIVVNDGSSDNTAEIVKEFPVKLINHPVNKGYGASLKTGIRHASGSKVVFMDSDGQHNPTDIDALVGLLADNEMVIGERSADSFQVGNRKAGKRLIRWIGEYLVEQKLPDFNSGFRGIDRQIIMQMLHIMPNGFSFSTTSTLAFIKEGFNVATMPIKVEGREGRKSNVRFLKDGSKTILLLFRITMLFNPLKVFFPVSLLVGLLGSVWGIYGFLSAGRFPNSAIVLIILGMFVFFFGLLADQISILNRKSHYNEK